MISTFKILIFVKSVFGRINSGFDYPRGSISAYFGELCEEVGEGAKNVKYFVILWKINTGFRTHRRGQFERGFVGGRPFAIETR